MADGILILGQNHTVLLTNRAAEQLVPMPPAAPPATLDALPIGEALLPAVRMVQADSASSQSIVVDAIVSPTTQRSLRAIVTQLPAPDHQQALVVLQDLTDLRRVEQSRRMVLANISHDLRTPLASLQAMIETLQDGALDDRAAAADFLARMDDEVQGLNRLVGEFLELTRIESGQLELALMPTNLRMVLANVAARMAAQSQQHGVAIELALPASLPVVNADAARIEQVLLNLLQNALAFTPGGGRITVGVDVQADHVAIW
jgi:two-component system phosphate regulon sensor histidine kinase PhoR